jgi:carboxypeptidase Taq
LGSAYSAQMLHYAKKDFDIDAAIANGDIPKITEWLTKHIHQYGSIYEPKDLFKKIAGEDLNAKYYVDYLEKKFGTLYEL